MSHPEGEGPSDRAASKALARQNLKDPKHDAEPGSKRDLRTVDDDLEDPKHHKEKP